MELIQPNDPQYFRETSTSPYDRHRYKVNFKDGKSKVFEDWMSAQGFWFEQVQTGRLSTIEILDEGSGKGFL